MSVEYRLVFSSDINIHTANNLKNQICNILPLDDCAELIILFSSEGGSTDQSLSLFNFISNLEFPIQMHAMGHIGSAAVPVFLAAEKRTAEPSARFFLHEYHWTFEGSQTLYRINEAAQRLKSDIDTAKEIIKNRTSVPVNLLESISGGSSSAIFDVTKAKKFGFIDKILGLGKTSRNGFKVKTFNV